MKVLWSTVSPVFLADKSEKSGLHLAMSVARIIMILSSVDRVISGNYEREMIMNDVLPYGGHPHTDSRDYNGSRSGAVWPLLAVFTESGSLF
jgi:hypothetical protein